MENDTLHEKLWNVSYDCLKQNCIIASGLTSIMQKRAEHLRSQLTFSHTGRSTTFTNDFRKAYDELQSMGKSVQHFVLEWQELCMTETADVNEEDSVAFEWAKFDFIKLPLEYDHDQVVDLLITYIPKTPHDIFFAIDKRRSSIFEFYRALQKVPKHPLEQVPTSGNVFAIKLDNIWIRAVRNRPAGNGGNDAITLCLIDSGEVLPYQDTCCIAELPDEFQTIPAFVHKCRMVPGESLAVKNRYDFISCKVVEIEDGDVLKLEHLPNNQSNGLLETDTKLKEVQKSHLNEAQASQNDDEEPQKDDHLVLLNDTHKSAEQLPQIQLNGESSRGDLRYEISRETLSKEQLEQFDELPESTTNAMKAILGYVPKDDEQICNFYDPKTKGCFKGGNCRRRHIEKDPDGWTRDRDTVSVSVVEKMEIPATNTSVTLVPTMVIDFELFYSQLFTDSMAFYQLTADLNNPEIVTNYRKLKLLPTVGELVVAKYENAWYRAQVCELFDENVSVFYVDYGNVETLPMDDVRVCEDRFKYLAYQAIACRVANARHLKPYHTEAIEQFSAAILDKKIVALIIDNKTPWEVQIFDEDGFDIGQGMITANLALPRTPSKIDDETKIPG